MKRIIPAALLATLTGCASTGPTWHDYVIPGPGGVNTSTVTSTDSTPDESKTYALRFARDACNDEGKKLVVTDQESVYIGPGAAMTAATTAATVAAMIYAKNTNRGYTAPTGPANWKTTLTFNCE